jgi:hypothetical protein
MGARHRTLGAIALVCAAPAGACGGRDAPRASEPRPAAPIVVTAAIGPERVSVSPARFGAGPISLVVVNQTDASQQVTLESDGPIGSGPGLRQETAPINPRDTGSLQAEVEPGRYTVQVAGEGIVPARVRVGAARPSAQGELLQP